MSLKSISDLDLKAKHIFLRADLDFDPHEPNELRLQVALDVIKKCLSMGAQRIFLACHRGREGDSLRELAPLIEKEIKKTVYFVDDVYMDRTIEVPEKGAIYLLENLRRWEGEVANDSNFAHQILTLTGAAVYINESFAVSHRKHASIVALPQIIKKSGGQVGVGLRFEQEIETLSKVLNDPKHPVITIIGGVKKDKLDFITPLTKFSDKVLVGGRLPEYIDEESNLRSSAKILVGKLNQDKEDITLKTAEEFENIIKSAKTIVFAGPMGKYEEVGQRLGTQRVLQAISDSDAFKIAGGGDSTTAIKSLGLPKAFDWISVGGGAMLKFLSHASLPGIDALVN